MMSNAELQAERVKAAAAAKPMALPRLRILPFLITLAVVAAAGFLGWKAWGLYMGSPWTRDGTVRAYVVRIAPEVAGKIVQLPVRDNQFVHKGDLLVLIDPTNYAIAVRQAQAAVEQTRALAENAQRESTRRQELNSLAVTTEEQQTYASQAVSAQANYQSALASLDTARVNLERTRIRSPVNGYVTNLFAQLGDYANVGQRIISVVNSDSFWVDAYFEETFLGQIREGDGALVKLMGYRPILRGTVQSVARGINVPNAQADAAGLASVNPIFTFVRLAQRVPVRIHLEDVPDDVKLVIGLTATVQIEPRAAPATGAPSATANEPAPQAAAPAQSAPVEVAENALPPLNANAPVAPPAKQVDPLSKADEAEFARESEYLGRTIDIMAGDQAAAPARHHYPEALRRRAHERRWRRPQN